MPATQIEPDDGNETLDGIIDRGHGEEGFGVCHEAVHTSQDALACELALDLLGTLRNRLCNSFQHRSRLENEGW